jgi:hypothetical protein
MNTYREQLAARIENQTARAAKLAAEIDAMLADSARLIESLRSWQAVTRPETRVFVDSEG